VTPLTEHQRVCAPKQQLWRAAGHQGAQQMHVMMQLCDAAPGAHTQSHIQTAKLCV
jgi:hypothetical protein